MLLIFFELDVIVYLHYSQSKRQTSPDAEIFLLQETHSSPDHNPMRDFRAQHESERIPNNKSPADLGQIPARIGQTRRPISVLFLDKATKQHIATPVQLFPSLGIGCQRGPWSVSLINSFATCKVLLICLAYE